MDAKSYLSPTTIGAGQNRQTSVLTSDVNTKMVTTNSINTNTPIPPAIRGLNPVVVATSGGTTVSSATKSTGKAASTTSTVPTLSATASFMSPSSSTNVPLEDRLHGTWKSIAQSVVITMNKAEKASTISGQIDLEGKKSALHEVKKAIEEFIYSRSKWNQMITGIETTLEGKVEEVQNLQQFVTCYPSVGVLRRKRKRSTEIFDTTTTLENIMDGDV